MSQSQAQNALSQVGLQPETSVKQTNDVAQGTVIAQDPKTGTAVESGSSVQIVIAQKAAPTVTATTVTPTPTETPSPSPTPSGTTSP